MARVALVTGGVRGIGAAICRTLQCAGVRVVANYRTGEDRARQFAAQTDIPAYQWDVADHDATAMAVTRIEAEVGPIDILVNNAGITRDATLLKMSFEEWDEVIRTNLGGAFNMAKATFPGMKDRGWGRIVSIGSINGQAGQFGQVNYSAAKAGLQGFTKALAQEGARCGVTVNLVAPGYVDTDMVSTLRPDLLDRIIARIPTGRLSRPEEVAAAVDFLCREDSGQITGSCLSVNGGQHMY